MTTKKAKGALSDDVKLFIVRQLAAYESPKKVAELVKEEFGLDVPRQQIECYDPEKRAGERMSEKLKAEFRRARAAFEADLEGIPEAKRAVRIKMLAQEARKAQSKGNGVGMAGFLEQIAKEVGEAFTNTRVVKGAVAVTGEDGGPVKHEHAHTWDADAAVRGALGELESGEEHHGPVAPAAAPE